MVLRRRGSISRTFWFYGLSYKLAIVKSFKANARNDSIYIINSVDETKSILNHNGPVDPFIWNEDGNSSFFCLKKKKKKHPVLTSNIKSSYTLLQLVHRYNPQDRT